MMKIKCSKCGYDKNPADAARKYTAVCEACGRMCTGRSRRCMACERLRKRIVSEESRRETSVRTMRWFAKRRRTERIKGRIKHGK